MMEEKMLPVPNEGHRRRQKQRRRRFPWGSIATVILVVAVCVNAFTLFGSETISGRVSAYEDTMQDAVIEQSAATVWEVRDRCSKKIGELRKTARKCKEADVEIKHYYNLRFISL